MGQDSKHLYSQTVQMGLMSHEEAGLSSGCVSAHMPGTYNIVQQVMSSPSSSMQPSGGLRLNSISSFCMAR